MPTTPTSTPDSQPSATRTQSRSQPSLTQNRRWTNLPTSEHPTHLPNIDTNQSSKPRDDVDRNPVTAQNFTPVLIAQHFIPVASQDQPNPASSRLRPITITVPVPTSLMANLHTLPVTAPVLTPQCTLTVTARPTMTPDVLTVQRPTLTATSVPLPNSTATMVPHPMSTAKPITTAVPRPKLTVTLVSSPASAVPLAQLPLPANPRPTSVPSYDPTLTRPNAAQPTDNLSTATSPTPVPKYDPNFTQPDVVQPIDNLLPAPSTHTHKDPYPFPSMGLLTSLPTTFDYTRHFEDIATCLLTDKLNDMKGSVTAAFDNKVHCETNILFDT